MNTATSTIYSVYIRDILFLHFAKAAKVVLEHRGDGGTGWSMGWKLNQWARLQDGNHAKQFIKQWYWNIADEISVAGITEMLLQSHTGTIQLLPALPDAWTNGSISGICAKGNYEISILWKKEDWKKLAFFLSPEGLVL